MLAAGLLEVARLHYRHRDLVEAVVQNVETGDSFDTLRRTAAQVFVGTRCFAYVALS